MSKPIKISASKSLVNRYLILKEGHSLLNLIWFSEAEDVQNLLKALKAAPESKEYYLGEGGTTLRFFASYLSTYNGTWILKCKESLLKRPQAELTKALKLLGADLIQIDSTTLSLKSEGWQTDKISINMMDSTQILTGLVVAALSRGLPLEVKLQDVGVNSDYFELTKSYVRELGFDLSHTENTIAVPGDQKLSAEKSGVVEADWSSAAFLMVLGALKGRVCIEGLNQKSFQPDFAILKFLNQVGASVDNSGCVDRGSLPYGAFSINIQKSPDLFPVLSVLACFCEGESKIFGAPQLKNKESNRISKISDLLKLCGYKVTALDDGINIEGQGLKILTDSPIEFDVSKDHRLYMATEILTAMGYNIQVNGARSILKSFSEYEKIKEGPLSCFF